MNRPDKKLGKIFNQIFLSVEKSIVEKIEKGDRKEEDHITSTLFTLLEERINGFNHSSLKISAKQFPGRGANSDESITGADGALILDINLDGLEFKKTVLLQAKKFFQTKDKFDDRSIHQKYKMLSFTPDSFFLVYQKKKVSFVSAFLVGSGDKLNQLPSKRVTSFLEDYFNCFIGDHLIIFPPHPFRHPWRYWLLLEELPRYFKFDDKMSMAKNNLLIKIEDSKSGS